MTKQSGVFAEFGDTASPGSYNIGVAINPLSTNQCELGLIVPSKIDTTEHHSMQEGDVIAHPTLALFDSLTLGFAVKSSNK